MGKNKGIKETLDDYLNGLSQAEASEQEDRSMNLLSSIFFMSRSMPLFVACFEAVQILINKKEDKKDTKMERFILLMLILMAEMEKDGIIKINSNPQESKK